ncbi:MAG: hypothetical protein U0996_10955 [Planctomycetaceae bacterium]
MSRRFQSGRGDSGSLLASLFILALGGAGCLFTVAAMAPSSLPWAMGAVGGVFAIFVLFVVLQRFGKTPGTSLGFLLSARRNTRDDGLKDYEPRKAGDRRTAPAGTNRPISAEEAHEIRVTSANTWVPAKGRPRSE